MMHALPMAFLCLHLATPGDAELAAARKAFAEADVDATMKAAQAASSAQPSNREPLVILSALANAMRDEKLAREVHKKLSVMPAPAAKPSAAVTGEKLDVDATAQVNGTHLNVRASPDAAATRVAVLPYAAPVIVRELRGEWARVLAPGGPGAAPWESGWVLAAYLSREVPGVDALVEDAEKAEESGDPARAAMLFERASLVVTDKPEEDMETMVLQHWLKDAVAARDYPSAAAALVRLQPTRVRWKTFEYAGVSPAKGFDALVADAGPEASRGTDAGPSHQGNAKAGPGLRKRAVDVVSYTVQRRQLTRVELHFKPSARCQDVLTQLQRAYGEPRSTGHSNEEAFDYVVQTWWNDDSRLSLTCADAENARADTLRIELRR